MPVTVVAMHGAGSSPDVAEEAFRPLGEVTSFWVAGHGGTAPAPAHDDGARDRASLQALVWKVRPHTVAGISYGAHQVARWAATGAARRSGVRRLVLAMPAWTGPPDATAGLTCAQADDFVRNGIDASLARITHEHPGWVADALAMSWPHHDVRGLVPALRAAAASRGPSAEELAAIDVPTVVVALASDPLHPLAVAVRWAETIATAHHAVSAGTSLADLGNAALAAR